MAPNWHTETTKQRLRQWFVHETEYELIVSQKQLDQLRDGETLVAEVPVGTRERVNFIIRVE